MTDRIVPKEQLLLERAPLSALDRIGRRLIFAMLDGITSGELTVVDAAETRKFGQPTPDFDLRARVVVQDPRFYTAAAFGGSVGAAEAYMAGFWTTDDLTAMIRIMTRNQLARKQIDGLWASLIQPVHRVFHFFHKNTRQGSRANIVAHYDLGNDFYRLFLDPTLTYSCGIFETPTSSLTDASIAKYDRICRKLQLRPDDRVIEIGTGWGGFALHAVQHYGCRITTTTISDEQYALAGQRFQEAGIADRVTLLQQDYRVLSGTFDKLVSIEMIEAVGHQFYDTFFEVCSRLLAPDGMMLLQAITIADQDFDRHKHSVDFIKRYIFPGSCIPSVTAMSRSIARKTDLRLFHLEDITSHYPNTLRCWRENFLSRIDDVQKMGYSDAFIRMWEYYLCYCEGGFAERYIGDVQMLLTKPLCRREPILPQLP